MKEIVKEFLKKIHLYKFCCLIITNYNPVYFLYTLFLIVYFKFSINGKQKMSGIQAFKFVKRNFLKKFKPIQKDSEFIQTINLIDKIKPKIIMEIGTFNGGSLFVFSKMLSDNGHIISLDFPGRFFFGIPYIKLDKYIYKNFVNKTQKIDILIGDSHSLEKINEVKEKLNSNKLDILFIDGDHSYQGVKQDYENYRSLVKKDGLIIFHDILPGNQYGVDVFWDEVKQNKKYYEFIEDKNQISYGIGILIAM